MSKIRLKQIYSENGEEGAVVVIRNGKPEWLPSRFESSFVSSDLTGGTLEVSHSLGRKYVHVSVFDEDDTVVYPDSIKLIDSENISVDLSSFVSLLETASGDGKSWMIVVS